MIVRIKSYSFPTLIAFITCLVLIIGGIFYVSGYQEIFLNLFRFSVLILVLPLWFSILRDILKGHFGVDLIAGVAILGAYLLEQYLPGLVLILMLSGGQALEAYAMRRAKFELSRLLERSPTRATKKENGIYKEISVDEINPGDEILIKSGEIIPVDGIVIEGNSLINEASLTGESLPVEKNVGSFVSSGTENTTGSILIRAIKIAKESRYAKIVALVKNAQESKAPIVRLADKYAVVFTVITFGISSLAYLFSHDWIRVLSVFVVATPCPLILATPIAIISGMSRAAKFGIIVKNGGALENLAEVRTILFDKTGTITMGVPEIEKVEVTKGDEGEILRLSASLDLSSSHILARSIVLEAKHKKISFSEINNFKETFGEGVEGFINDEEYFLGKLSFLKTKNVNISSVVEQEHGKHKGDGKMSVYLARGGELLGAIIFSDVVRKDIEGIFEKLTNNYGVACAMVTGDHENIARRIGKSVGISTIYADCQPEDKVLIVEKASRENGPVAMVGDGINDAPALARADVGIALASYGDTATSDASDVVIIHSSIKRVSDIYQISRKTLDIAKQGIFIGIGLSALAMVFAAFGYIKPLSGALLQEAIDVLVILNALRVLRIRV
ncbi:MAG: heavy metal translocating P-type ATPase [Candidatus Parcubacteria bacterium]|nr:heavy metal translocating P-type ATPase [Candidatus Parcubacteria bacterium]